MATKLNMIAGLYETFNFEQLPVDGVTQLTVAKFTTTTADGDPQVAKRAIITVEDGQIRYRMDGANPTASVGHLLNPMDTLVIIGNQNMNNFRAIKVSSVGEINVSYEK